MIGRSMPSASTTTRVATRFTTGVGRRAAPTRRRTTIGRQGRERGGWLAGSAATIVGSAESDGSAAADASRV